MRPGFRARPANLSTTIRAKREYVTRPGTTTPVLVGISHRAKAGQLCWPGPYKGGGKGRVSGPHDAGRQSASPIRLVRGVSDSDSASDGLRLLQHELPAGLGQPCLISSGAMDVPAAAADRQI